MTPPAATVAFDSGHLLERGTDVALYDYAHFNETLLGNRSRVVCPADADISCIDKFRSRFPVYLYRSDLDLSEYLSDVDLYYRIDSGENPGKELPRPPSGRTAVHCVFRADQPHGDVYASVSTWVAEHRGLGQGRVPTVPHMVHLPDVHGDLRQELGIPEDATVLGRHGGLETFNIPFVPAVIQQALDQREDLWLVFLNTRPFLSHPRLLHLPATSDMERKTRFINSCDGMLHARLEGETFGLSVGEFSIRNRPVITWVGGYDNHHVEVLGEKGIYYRTAADLQQILLRFRAMPGDWDAFSERFAPEPVMRRFAEVFLATTGSSTVVVPPGQPRRRGAPLRI